MSAAALRLIVGLGNPGPQYEQTRHNAGFWLADELVRRYGGFFRTESKFGGDACRISISGHSVWVLKPMMFMNRSGQAIARLAGFYKFARPEILIVHDDLDLPPGVVRLKQAGGHGGHNGLRDSIQQLGGNDFSRLRLGIGRPEDSRDVVGYVLRRPPESERRLIEQALLDAAREFPLIVPGQFGKAMQTLHSRQPDTAGG